MLGRAHKLHRRVIDEHVTEFDVRVVPGDLDRDVAPQLGALEHVHLVDRAQLLAALLCRLERHLEDAADLVFGVDHRVPAHTLLRALDFTHFDPARLAEVDVAGELTHDQDIKAGDDFRLQ